jgi:hypothetical protein
MFSFETSGPFIFQEIDLGDFNPARWTYIITQTALPPIPPGLVLAITPDTIGGVKSECSVHSGAPTEPIEFRGTFIPDITRDSICAIKYEYTPSSG